MSSLPPPIGLTGIGFDALTIVVALTGLVMFGGLALLLWAVRARDRAEYEVRPVRRTEAIIDVRTPRGAPRVDVESCSLCGPPECEKCHVRLVA